MYGGVIGVMLHTRLGRSLSPEVRSGRTPFVGSGASSCDEDGSDDCHADAHGLEPEADLQSQVFQTYVPM
jgi:hypothetical protein